VIKRKDGTTFPAELNASVIIQDGKPTDFVFVRDLSEQKKSEDELKSSAERFKIIFESTPDAYYLCDLKGNFIDGNKASENLLGYKREELKGKNLLELGLLPTIQFPKAITILAKNALGLNTGPDVFTIKRKDGHEIDVELTTLTVQLQNETAVLAIGRAATKNKRNVLGIRKKDEIYHITAKHIK
jgi:PAS domain S-box-containing protein